MKRFILIALILAVGQMLHADQKQSRLKESVELINLIWTQWMHKPKLEYEQIDTKAMARYYGDWHGEYVSDGDNVNATLTIKKDGSWTSSQWEVGKEARWYIAEGMILLFEKPIKDPDADLAAAVILRNGALHLINKQAKGGLIQLTKKKRQNKTLHTNP